MNLFIHNIENGGRRFPLSNNLIMKYGVLSSSVNPEKLSLAVSGAIKLIPILLTLAGLFGVSLNGAELEAVFNSFLGAILSLVAVWSAGEVLWGSVRKVLVRAGYYS